MNKGVRYVSFGVFEGSLGVNRPLRHSVHVVSGRARAPELTHSM